MAFARKTSARDAGPFTPEALEEATLRYLNRFDCSVEKLRSYMRTLVRRHGGDAALLAHGETLLERYRASGVLDDGRFAKNLAERMRGRGTSRRMLKKKLLARGIGRDVADEVARSSPESDLEAARAFARRRRIGPYRPEADRNANRRRDLAALARQGFDHDTALRALGYGSDEDF